MAEGVFRQLVADAGLTNKIYVDSAGTASYHVGETPHYGTQGIFRKHNIPYDNLARQFHKQDFADFDYILAMDHSNLKNIQKLMPAKSRAKAALLLDYAPALATKEVPDPYYDGRFDEVYELVKSGGIGLLQAIRQEHHL